jgi:hypothetical protein
LSQLPFDAQIVHDYRELTTQLLASHPELRSVVVVLDYHGKLNEAQVDHALWMGEAGAVTAPDAVLGGMGNILRVLHAMFERAALLQGALHDELARVLKELGQGRPPVDDTPAG